MVQTSTSDAAQYAACNLHQSRTSSARVGSDLPKTFRSASFTSGRNHHRSCRCPIAAASCTNATREVLTRDQHVRRWQQEKARAAGCTPDKTWTPRGAYAQGCLHRNKPATVQFATTQLQVEAVVRGQSPSADGPPVGALRAGQRPGGRHRPTWHSAPPRPCSKFRQSQLLHAFDCKRSMHRQVTIIAK